MKDAHLSRTRQQVHGTASHLWNQRWFLLTLPMFSNTPQTADISSETEAFGLNALLKDRRGPICSIHTAQLLSEGQTTMTGTFYGSLPLSMNATQHWSQYCCHWRLLTGPPINNSSLDDSTLTLGKGPPWHQLPEQNRRRYSSTPLSAYKVFNSSRRVSCTLGVLRID